MRAMSATTVYVQANGPYIVTGDFALDARAAPRDDSSVVLCRCGLSSNKPYCDGNHTRMAFVDAGALPSVIERNQTVDTGRLIITPKPNGPLVCVGPVRISGADGRVGEYHDVRFCRCGGSATKPFCDGTHRKIGFVG